jgi:8-oxo-dGTP diphosphatase
MNTDVSKLYGNKIRVRACGLCFHNNALLMINHTGITDRDFWSPPGGGIELGQSTAETLVREFKEEAGITITSGEFKFGCEYINAPLHAIELFFRADYQSGEIKTGTDPEMGEKNQIIKEVRWISLDELRSMPNQYLHGIFKVCEKPEEILQLSGFWRI